MTRGYVSVRETPASRVPRCRGGKTSPPARASRLPEKDGLRETPASRGPRCRGGKRSPPARASRVPEKGGPPYHRVGPPRFATSLRTRRGRPATSFAKKRAEVRRHSRSTRASQACLLALLTFTPQRHRGDAIAASSTRRVTSAHTWVKFYGELSKQTHFPTAYSQYGLVPNHVHFKAVFSKRASSNPRSF
jgi:hypothetical protein